MKIKVSFIERKFWEFVSIEKVFRQISESLPEEDFECRFEQLAYGNSLYGLIKNLVFFRPEEADLYHITGHIHYIALRLPPEKTVLTIHDLGFLRTARGLRRYVLKKLYLDWPVRHIKYITAISEATKKEIVRQTSCPENKIRVIGNPYFSNLSAGKKKAFDPERPQILQIGTAPHKNLKTLAAAIAGLDCRLDIVGRLDSADLELLTRYGIDYKNSFGLDEGEMLEKYRHADILAFCSTYEGFGLPVIEAQAMRTPVVTSRISPLAEVAGRGAVLVDPLRPEEIKAGILRLITDEPFRSAVVAAGLENIERFDPSLIAGKYAELYLEMTDAKREGIDAGK
jgi:glycosyltransferase involved in cell wall biosynthesis